MVSLVVVGEEEIVAATIDAVEAAINNVKPNQELVIFHEMRLMERL